MKEMQLIHSRNILYMKIICSSVQRNIRHRRKWIMERLSSDLVAACARISLLPGKNERAGVALCVESPSLQEL